MDSRNYASKKRRLSKLRYSLLGALLVAALALTPLRPLKVTGHSMEPTLRDGETYLLDQFYWQPSGVCRGDIVVVKQGEEKWVKRLIGMPGDRLLISYRLDGAIAQVSNLTVNPSLRGTPGFPEERTMASDEIFVIGDNLNHSVDSTYPEAGAFKMKDIIGVVRTLTLRRDFPFRHHL